MNDAQNWTIIFGLLTSLWAVMVYLLRRVDTRFDGLEVRFDRLEAKIDGRFDRLEARVDGLDRDVTALTRRGLDDQ